MNTTSPAPYSIFGAAKPAGPADPDRDHVELGVKFKSSADGSITGIRFYKHSNNKGTHTGKLWASSGKLLSTTTFRNESASGWQTATFATPVRVTAGRTYIASYVAPRGQYADDQWALSPSEPKVSKSLTALQGLYTYSGGIPRLTWRNSNYFVDPIFKPAGSDGGPSQTSPTTSTSTQTSTTRPTTTAPTRTTTARPPTTRTSTTTSAPPTSTTAKPSTSSSRTSTPSSTSTSTPAGKCVGSPNTPGGADPWGGCWPGPHNTGYPHGLPGDTRTPVKLTNYTGPTTIRSCGVVIDSKIVPQDLLIEAGNGSRDLSKPCVTIKNSLVKGVIFSERSTWGPILIEDTEVVPNGLSWWENIGRSNFKAVRVNSHGSQGVIKCDQNCEAIDSWVHGMVVGKAYHYNAFGGNGTNGFRIEHNYGTCGDWSGTEAGLSGDAGCSAVIGFYGDYAMNQNITIKRNFLESTFDMSSSGKYRQAGYCLNPGFYPGKPYPDTRNIAVTDNVFGLGGSGKCGVYGPSNSLNKAGARNGNSWSNNRYENGTEIRWPEE